MPEVEIKEGAPIFGTDGVRDRAGQGFLAPLSVAGIVAATASILRGPEAFPEDFPRRTSGDAVIIGRDTRRSGEDLGQQLTAGFLRAGFDVHDVGILPTPGVAALAARWPRVALGIVVSASHNPAEYNGIKLFAPTGAKVSPDLERAVSCRYWNGDLEPAAPARPGTRADRSAAAFDDYVDYLAGRCQRRGRLMGRVIALDAANGATYRVAPEVFRRLGADPRCLGVTPDGDNINKDCGALHPERLAELVRKSGAALGISFDGDGDRMIPITASGRILDGDHVLYLAGRALSRAGQLPRRTVVATSMSNLGLELALRAEGLRLERTDVGDRNVYLAMLAGGHPIGGEQSGHLIFLDHARTGDGILAALRLIDVLDGDALDVDEAVQAVRRYPQVLRNVKVREKVPLESLPAVRAAVEAAKATLQGEGRIVLRYSGTEPLARVMLEGPEEALVSSLADAICDAIRRNIPGSA